uniref:Uncharacterized protein n=1 Tax=Haptolina brevifila TaxID=156173 RepID=A0A7S2N946_9EUKA
MIATRISPRHRRGSRPPSLRGLHWRLTFKIAGEMHTTTQMYEIEIPGGVYPGQAFQASVGGQMMLITCPENVAAGSTIQVAGPSLNAPTVAGVPVSSTNGLMGDPIAAGQPVPQVMMGSLGGLGSHPHVMMGSLGGHHGPEVAYVEVDEITPSGWLCLIVGCFACPGLNLLGLCMRERRLVPVSHMHY